MNAALTTEELIVARKRNIVAAALSVVPGLGHIYKGHYAAGALTMVLGPPLAIWVGILLSLATLGLGLIVPVGFWVWVAFAAFYEGDRRHPLPVTNVGLV